MGTEDSLANTGVYHAEALALLSQSMACAASAHQRLTKLAMTDKALGAIATCAEELARAATRVRNIEEERGSP